MQPSAMEPTLPDDRNQVLENLVVELVAKSSQLAGQVKPQVRDSIGDLVRSMNCNYSNLIEGRYTHPRDIDSAMHDRFSENPEKRALQQEAMAHIDVQRMIDAGAVPGEPVMSKDSPLWPD
jgi:hypothetical protein